jgi:hypothetical protein
MLVPVMELQKEHSQMEEELSHSQKEAAQR